MDADLASADGATGLRGHRLTTPADPREDAMTIDASSVTDAPTIAAPPAAPTLSTFASWPKLVYGRVSFTAPCPCGRDALWEQVGQAGIDRYEISCSCVTAAAVGPAAADPAA